MPATSRLNDNIKQQESLKGVTSSETSYLVDMFSLHCHTRYRSTTFYECANLSVYHDHALLSSFTFQNPHHTAAMTLYGRIGQHLSGPLFVRASLTPSGMCGLLANESTYNAVIDSQSRTKRKNAKMTREVIPICQENAHVTDPQLFCIQMNHPFAATVFTLGVIEMWR